MLIKHKVITLNQLLNVVGLDFKNELALAQHLGSRSIRLVTQLLMKWQAALKTTEKDLLVEYFAGSRDSNPKDSFRCLFLSVNVEGITSPFIESVASLC